LNRLVNGSLSLLIISRLLSLTIAIWLTSFQTILVGPSENFLIRTTAYDQLVISHG
jgi:hypothetical protein